jgi:hypothetical protein
MPSGVCSRSGETVICQALDTSSENGCGFGDLGVLTASKGSFARFLPDSAKLQYSQVREGGRSQIGGYT